MERNILKKCLRYNKDEISSSKHLLNTIKYGPMGPRLENFKVCAE